MARLVPTLLLLTIQYVLLNGSKRVRKVIYTPYGPKMCRRLSEDVISSFTYVKEELSCRLASDSLTGKELFNEDSITTHNTELVKNDSISVPEFPVDESCDANYEDLKASPQENLTRILHQACRQGLSCTVKYILSQSLADINCRGRFGRTPVMVAARYRQGAVFDFLLSQSCDLDALDDYNNTVLHMACMGGYTNITKRLLEVKNYDINGRGNHSWTPVMVAAAFGQGGAFDLLVSKGSNMTLLDKTNCNILHIACQGGSVHIVKYILLKTIINIDSRGYSGMTAVMFAAEKGHVNVFVVLEKSGCDMKVVDHLKHNVLHVACLGGHVDMVKYILSRGIVDIDSKGYKGRTPVMMASQKGHLDVVELLARKGCNVSIVDEQSYNILHIACLGGHVHMVECILARKLADINAKGYEHRTPVMLAAGRGHMKVVKCLLRKGCNLRTLDKQMNNILHIACAGGHVPMVDCILSKAMFNINGRGYLGRTHVMAAAENNHVGVVKLLVRRGCDLKIVDDDNSNLLHLTCCYSNVKMVKYILSLHIFNMESRGQKGKTAVLYAAYGGQRDVVELLVNKGCNLRFTDEEKNNFIHTACLSGHVDVVRYVLSLRILDIDSKAIGHNTPVMLAAYMGHTEVVNLLWRSGCDVRAVNQLKNNVLHVSCLGGHVGVVRYILSKGIHDIDSKGFRGKTPVLMAAVKGHWEVLKLLLQRGCDLKVTDEQNNNILHTTCIHGYLDLVDNILSQNLSDIESKNIFGRTPVMVAALDGHRNVVELLISKGCNLQTRDRRKNTIIHIACIGGFTNVVKFVLSKGIHIESRGFFGRTPVITAAEFGHRGVVELLKSKHCNMQAVDTQGNNVLHVACFGGHADVVKYLLSLREVNRWAKNKLGMTAVKVAAEKGHQSVVDLFRNEE